MKTIKQAAKEFAEGEVMETYDSAIEALKRISFIEGAKFAQQWINVEDELPLESADEILIKDDESTLVAVYRFGKFNTGFSFEFNPTHWRPIERK